DVDENEFVDLDNDGFCEIFKMKKESIDSIIHPDNITEFETAMKFLMYSSALPVSLKSLINKTTRDNLKREKNMIAYSFYNSRSGYATLDILVDTPFDFNEMWIEKEIRKDRDLELFLVSIEHLIELKKYSNRKQDIDDVILLSKILKK
ncbi:MAG: hypothetical protein ACHQFW_08655, partial [Chitinophagales bacterium]